MEKLKEKKIFNEFGDTDINLKKIVNGNTTNINDFNNMKYKWASDWYRQAMNNFWIPEEINLSQDLKDYPNLTEHERTAYDKVLSFLVFLDSVQTANLPNVNDYITASEVNLCINIQTFQESIHCFKEGTEILTSEGWKDFRDLTYNDLIANYNEDQSITFTKPIDIISSYYRGDLIDFRNKKCDISVTPNHRMIKLNKFGDIEVQYAENIDYSDSKMPVSGFVKGEKYSLSNDERFNIIYQSIGYLVNPDTNKEYYIYSFTFNNEEKITNFINFIHSLNLTYSVNKHGNNFNVTVWHHKRFYKNFDWVDLTKISSSYIKEFINEVCYWSNKYAGSLYYVNKDKFIIDKLSALASLCGYVSYIYPTENNNYIIHFFEQNSIGGSKIAKTKTYYEGNVYCVTVPSSFVIVKNNDKIIVSGNSQSYSYMLDTICSPEKRNQILFYWKDDEHLLKRNKFIGDIYNKFVENKDMNTFLEVCVANYILEGIYFYSGFMFFYNLARNSKMSGSAQEIRYINRDENTHLWLFRNILKELQKEYPEYFNEENNEYFKAMIKEGCEQEKAWGEYVIGNNIEGLTVDMVKDYIEYLGNLRSQDLGFGIIYPNNISEPENMDWVTYYSNANAIKTDFFEARVTAYAKSTALEDDL